MPVKELLLTALLTVFAVNPASASEPEAWAALREGAIVLFRHANAPGGGDPPVFKLGNCATQRNLDAAGRDQASKIGERLGQERVIVGAVLTSQWCRSVDTARLAFGTMAKEEPVFNSFFDDRSKGPEQTRAAVRILTEWTRAGSLAVVTHQVNITALTRIVPASGEGIVVRVANGTINVIGRIKP